MAEVCDPRPKVPLGGIELGNELYNRQIRYIGIHRGYKIGSEG